MTEHTIKGQAVNPWLTAAKNIIPDSLIPVSPQESLEPQLADSGAPVFVAAHGGAGTTSWAHILGGVDGGLVSNQERETPVPDADTVLVARASLDGVDAAKAAIAIHGYERFACVLLVPSSPTKMPRLIANEVKVLSGAISIITVPWTPPLLVRRAAQLSPTDISPKELIKIIASFSQVGVTIKGETP